MDFGGLISRSVLDNTSRLKSRFNTSLPYRHVIIEDFLDEEFSRRLFAQIPDLDDERWVMGVRKNIDEEKNIFESNRYAINDPNELSSDFVDLFTSINSNSFCNFLSDITGIKDMMPDLSWHLSGLRLMTPGSHQLIHSDSRIHPSLRNKKNQPLEKKLTMLIYMNEGWTESDTGQCELWNDEMTQCVKSVRPTFNTCLIFECTNTSYHGVPNVTFKNKNRINLTFNFLLDSQTKELRPKAYFVPRPEDAHIKNFKEIAHKRAYGDDKGAY